MKKNPIVVIDPLEVGKVVNGTIDSITKYLSSKEEQKTERERIEASLNAIVKKMETDQEKFNSYMTSSFSERDKLYKKVDALLNKSIEDGNLEMCKLALNFMANVYNKNPMEGFQDTLTSMSPDLLTSETMSKG